jgi:4-hydroxyacetophenone monooxygenase
MYNDKIHATLQIDPDWPHPDRSVNAINDEHRDYFTRHIRRELANRPDLVAKVLPDYPPFGKRILMDSGWFKTLTRGNVNLVTDGLSRIRESWIETDRGDKCEVDVIIFATGFHSRRLLWPMELRGRGGIDIREAWGEDDARAYLGITVPDFPNLFMLYGPNTNLGHGGSIVFHTECQVRYIMGLLHLMRDEHIASVECKVEVHDEYNSRLDAAHERMIWTHPGMQTWYRNAHGRVVTNSPWRLVDYWRMTRTPSLDDYIVVKGR